MTDNKCALPNQANWSVPFWNGKRKRKQFIGNKNCGIMSTLYYASPPCKITGMNLLENQTRYISHIYDFRLARPFSQSDSVKFYTHSENTSRVCTCQCAGHTEICVSMKLVTNEPTANDLWSNLNPWVNKKSKHNLFNALTCVNHSIWATGKDVSLLFLFDIIITVFQHISRYQDQFW